MQVHAQVREVLVVPASAAAGIADRSAWASFCEVQVFFALPFVLISKPAGSRVLVALMLQWPCRQSRSQLASESSAQTCSASFQEACPAGFDLCAQWVAVFAHAVRCLLRFSWAKSGSFCVAPGGSSSPCSLFVPACVL